MEMKLSIQYSVENYGSAGSENKNVKPLRIKNFINAYITLKYDNIDMGKENYALIIWYFWLKIGWEDYGTQIIAKIWRPQMPN